MGVYLPGASRLPSAYQEVEWIGSSATQYINTGYIPTINTEIETDLSWGSSQAEWGVFFGMTSNDDWKDGICGRIYSSSPTIFNPRFLNPAYGECQITTTTDTFHKVILKKNYCTLDGTAGTLTTTYSSPYSGAIYLFCGNNGGSTWRHTSVKFKSFKISESGTLQRNFIPCYRKSDNVIGMYDLVGGTFYTNSGSGTFTKGADVTGGELKNAYIGEYKGRTRPSTLKGGYWKLNGNMLDSSGNGHNGTGTANYSTGHDGVANHSYYASNTSYKVSIPNSSELYMLNGEKFSFGFRIKPTYASGTGATYGVISMTQTIDNASGRSIHNDSISRNRQLRTHKNGTYSSNVNQLTALNWNANERFFFVITYDGSTVRYYKNATLLGSISYTVGDCSTNQPLTIGYASTWSATGSAYYEDVFYMKDYCLDNTELSTIYNKGITL